MKITFDLKCSFRFNSKKRCEKFHFAPNYAGCEKNVRTQNFLFQ